MTPLLVPAIGGGVVAVASLAFYSLLAHFYGNAILGRLILLQAAISIVQMAVVPQTWLYVLGAADKAERDARYSIAMRLELLSGAVGALIVFAIASLPTDLLRANRSEALLMFGGLWIAGSTSHQGNFRSELRWPAFAAWMTMPALIRLALVMLAPMLDPDRPGPNDSLVGMTAVFFLLPDLCRFVSIHVPQMIARMRPITPGGLRAGLERIWHNWLYDVGSAVIENGDKLLVGALVNPTILVVYFFARRIGAAVTIAIEPLFAEFYRRAQQHPAHDRRRRQFDAYPRFLLAGVALACVVIAVIEGLARLPAIAAYLPDAVLAHRPVLFGLILIDAGICVNRWGRYASQQGWLSVMLLSARIALRALFGGCILAFATLGPGASVVVAYLVMWAVEVVVVIWLLRRPMGPATVPPAGRVGAGEAADPLISAALE